GLRKTRIGGWQRLAKIAENEAVGRRYAVRVRRHLALEDKDVALRKPHAEMIVCAAVAEPELEHRAGKLLDHRGGTIKASALRLQPGDVAVEAAHADLRSRSTSASASRSRLLLCSRR